MSDKYDKFPISEEAKEILRKGDEMFEAGRKLDRFKIPKHNRMMYDPITDTVISNKK